MALPVVYRRQVGRDLAAGFEYYEGQVKGLGERFLTAVGSAFDAIERYPQMFAQVHGEVRRALLSQFPYGVFYRVESKRVVVLAVLHMARNPSLWPQPRRSAR
jgi:plasmid stabilization system protein ParE